jgi:hypothetical protein
MFWSFYHEIRPGDTVVARRGRKTLAAVGTVTKAAYFASGRNPHLTTPGNLHPNFLDVGWLSASRQGFFDSRLLHHSVWEVTERQYQTLLEGSITKSDFVDATVEEPECFCFGKVHWYGSSQDMRFPQENAAFCFFIHFSPLTLSAPN